MNEVKRPKKPLIFYYVIAMVILLAINLFTVPWLAQRQVQEVDYGTFLQMAEDKDLGLVGEVFSPEILDRLGGTMAVGHVRYATTGGSRRENALSLIHI